MLLLCTALLGLPAPTASPLPDHFEPEPPLSAPAFGLVPSQVPTQRTRHRWQPGEMVLQGFFGANFYQTLEVSGGSGAEVDGSGEDSAQSPVIGGGAQWKLGGEKIDWGIEAMFSFSWRANATAIAVGGGGAAIAVDVDMSLIELYGGPVANVFLSDKTRVYVSAGPLMQWVDYNQGSSTAGIDDDGSGFGTGVYARTGIEFTIMPGTMMGLGVRWADSTTDLDGDLGDLELDGFQAVLTVTQGF